MTEPHPLPPEDRAKLQSLLAGEGHNVLVRLCRSVLSAQTGDVVDHGQISRAGVLAILRRIEQARQRGQHVEAPIMQGHRTLVGALEACHEHDVRILSVLCPEARYDVYASPALDTLVGCVRLPSPPPARA